MESFFRGALAMANALAGLFFLRFWFRTRDRLFLTFALSFWLLGAVRLGLSLTGEDDESRTWLYLLRLVAYVLIAIAIADKNLTHSRKEREATGRAG